jgi:hypothetical protein
MSGSYGRANKAVVLGIVEREGELRAVHIEDAKAKTWQGHIWQNVAKRSAALTTMTAPSSAFIVTIRT